MPHFDSWDLAPVPIPARSRLHSIQPIGVGTPFVESLTGYMIRLAASHAVRVSDLIEHELRTGIPYFHTAAGIPSAINGVGKNAQNWASAIERFTLRDNLRVLTLLPFASLLNTPYLMRRERAWCPRCYESSAAQGQEVYEQLVWCLQCVEICSLHTQPLETFLFPMPAVAGDPATFTGRDGTDALSDLGCSGVRTAPGNGAGCPAAGKTGDPEDSRPLR